MSDEIRRRGTVSGSNGSYFKSQDRGYVLQPPTSTPTDPKTSREKSRSQSRTQRNVVESEILTVSIAAAPRSDHYESEAAV